MTRVREWSLAVLAGTTFGTLWLAAVFAGELSNFPSVASLMVFWPFIVAPGVFAAKVMIHRARLAGDGPEQLFTVAAGLMPGRREDWVAAMRAELAHVPGTAARWAFAAGCLKAALAPRAGRVPVTAAALAGVAAAATLPAMTVFAVAFVGVFVLITPSAPPLPTVAGFLGLFGVAAGVISVTYLVFTFPSMGPALLPGSAIILGAVLACCARLALAPPRVLLGTAVVRGVGVLTSAAFVAGFLLASRLPGDDGAGMVGYLMFAGPVALFAVGAVVAAVGRSFRTGALAVTWTAVLTTPWLFVLWLVESVRWYRNDMGLLLDAEGGLPIGLNLKDGIVWVATWFPVWVLPLGLLGAAAGAAFQRVSVRN